MNDTSDYEKIVEQRFDSFCKTVLRNQARSIYAENKRWNEKFISLESLAHGELSRLCSYDTYEVECISFITHGYKIPIEDILIAQAIESLTSKQQEIKLINLEIRRNPLKTYITATLVITLVMIGFLYMFAAIPLLDDTEQDIGMFMNYDNIVTLTCILSMASFLILSSVMYA